MSALSRVLAGCLVIALGGCSVSDMPLPGAAPSGPSYRVTAEFSDALDLVPQAAVKVNDVTVGSVESIRLHGWAAQVRVKVDRKVKLPANAVAAIRQSSLLGEKFVDLAPPATEAATGELGDGAVIPLARTRRNAEVEEVLAALGLILSGGGLGQLKTINQELNKALGGRESDARGAVEQLNTLITALDKQKADIVKLIDALDRLSADLSSQTPVLAGAVDALPGGLKVLADQRAQLTTALTALGQLGTVGTRVVNASRDDTLADLKALQPTLDQLAKAGDNLPRALDFMLTYPFPPNVTKAIRGDFVNLHVTLDLDAATILASLLSAPPPAAGTPSTPATPAVPKLPAPKVPSVPGVPTIPGLPGSANAALPPTGEVQGSQGGLIDILGGGLIKK